MKRPEEFLNENNELNEAKKVKKFNKVKAGDIATDYNDMEWEVISTGKMKDLKDYDDSGMASDEFSDNDEVIAAYNSEHGENAVWSYGGDGIVVYESTINEGKMTIGSIVNFSTPETDGQIEGQIIKKRGNKYTIESRYGTFDVLGSEILDESVNEMEDCKHSVSITSDQMDKLHKDGSIEIDNIKISISSK
jgi:hypothetical protein